MPYDALRSQVEHLAQGIVIGKGRLVFGNLAELTVQSLDDIGGVNNLPDLRRIVEEGAQNLPVFLPAFDAGGILPTPLLGKQPQIVLRLLQRYRRVDLLQVCRDLLDVLIADILGGTADLMNNAALEAALGIDRLDGLHHAAKPIRTEQINLQNAPTFEVIEHV